MKITLTGASGFIGRRLIARLLADGHSLHVLGRKRGGLPQSVNFSVWDATAGEPLLESVEDVDAVIHLAGEPVAQRWTDEAKRRIRESRTTGTRNLVSAFGKITYRPRVLISASAVGIYGSRGEETLTEASPPGSGFLPDVCVAWENAADAAREFGLRVVRLRFGLVLGPEGGALKQMLPPFKMGVGGPLGDGKQWMSWIHVDDIIGLICFALQNGTFSGPVNATAPNPVRNSEFTHALAASLHRPAFLRVPEFALRAAFGEMSEIMLASQKVLPENALKASYSFQHPQIDEALKSVLK